MREPADRLLNGVVWKPIPWDESKSDNGTPRATHKGILTIGGYDLRCYQLDDGRRVIDSDDVLRFFGGIAAP